MLDIMCIVESCLSDANEIDASTDEGIWHQLHGQLRECMVSAE